VFEGEHHITDENRKLGEFLLTDIEPGPAVRNSSQMWQVAMHTHMQFAAILSQRMLPMVQFSEAMTNVLLFVFGGRDRPASLSICAWMKRECCRCLPQTTSQVTLLTVSIDAGMLCALLPCFYLVICSDDVFSCRAGRLHTSTTH
jgi:hypothetical protein